MSLWCLCSVLISMLYFKGLIYHVYLIYMSMSFMSSLINVKFLGVFSGTGINQSFFYPQGILLCITELPFYLFSVT